MKWTVILNPKSCSGKAARHWPRIAELLAGAGISYELKTTEHPGHAIALTEAAIVGGARHILAVGGDGTVNEVINGIFRQSAVPSTEVVISQIPIGTGNDWRRTMGIPKDYAKCVKLLQDWREIRQDVGLVEWEQNGQPQRRYFGNVAGMGFEAAVGLKANADKAAGKGGILGYIPALVGVLFKYQSTQAAFTLDGRSLPNREFFNLAIGICKYNGGGMKQCPDAIPDDGWFDITLVNKLSKATVIRNVPRLFTGKFVKDKHVEQHRARTVEVIAGPETLMEVDGENVGQGRARFTILPQTLRVATV